MVDKNVSLGLAAIVLVITSMSVSQLVFVDLDNSCYYDDYVNGMSLDEKKVFDFFYNKRVEEIANLTTGEINSDYSGLLYNVSVNNVELHRRVVKHFFYCKMKEFDKPVGVKEYTENYVNGGFVND